MYRSSFQTKQISPTDCIRVFIVYNCCRCIQKITITKWLQGLQKLQVHVYYTWSFFNIQTTSRQSNITINQQKYNTNTKTVNRISLDKNLTDNSNIKPQN